MQVDLSTSLTISLDAKLLLSSSDFHHERTLSNNVFFDRFFPANFWSTLDLSHFVTDEQSMFGDAHAFDWLIRTVRSKCTVPG